MRKINIIKNKVDTDVSFFPCERGLYMKFLEEYISIDNNFYKKTFNI